MLRQAAGQVRHILRVLIFHTLKGERLPLRSDPEPSAALQDPAGWKPFKREVSVKRNKDDYTLFFALSNNYGR